MRKISFLALIFALLLPYLANAQSSTPANIMLYDHSKTYTENLDGSFSGDYHNKGTDYCYWKYSTRNGKCKEYWTCKFYFGVKRGWTVFGKMVEYCDGHPTGVEIPIDAIYCGC